LFKASPIKFGVYGFLKAVENVTELIISALEFINDEKIAKNPDPIFFRNYGKFLSVDYNQDFAGIEDKCCANAQVCKT
jgi:hypothetical protein